MLAVAAQKGMLSYSGTPSPKNIYYVFLRPIKSLLEAHTSLPAMLKTLIITTYVAAKLAVTTEGRLVPKISSIIVLAQPMTPMPAVTLKHRINQRFQN